MSSIGVVMTGYSVDTQNMYVCVCVCGGGGVLKSFELITSV